MEVPPSDFLPQMRSLICNESFSDITFVIEGKRVPAHKAIVCTRCDYFRYVPAYLWSVLFLLYMLFLCAGFAFSDGSWN